MKNSVNSCSVLKDNEEWRIMYSKRNNIGFMSYDNANDIVDEFFKTIFSIYQEKLETPTRESDFIFNSVQILYHKCHNTF